MGCSERSSSLLSWLLFQNVSFVLMLKTNYNVKRIPLEKLEHTINVLRKYFPEKTSQRYLDPDIAEDKYRDFTVLGSVPPAIRV